MMTPQGRHDELKEWLARRWESNDSDPPTSSVGPMATTAGVKRKASTVLETPADSTEDVFTSSSRSTGGRKSSASKVSKNNILLASLLATRASTEQPVVNTLSIGSIATVTPQISLLRRAPADPHNSFIGDVGTMRRFSNSSLSSVTSVSTAEDTAGASLSSGSVQKASRLNRSYSENGSRDLNPILTEANLACVDASVDAKNDVTNQDPLPTDIMESLCASSAVSSALSLMDDTTLISQLEQFFSSPAGMITELESLLGDGNADLTSSSLFGSDQAGLGGQVAVTGVDNQSCSQSQQLSTGRTRGSGLLGQLLDGGSGHGTANSSFTATVTSEVLPPHRPTSLAVSSTYFHRGGTYSRTSPYCR